MEDSLESFEEFFEFVFFLFSCLWLEIHIRKNKRQKEECDDYGEYERDIYGNWQEFDEFTHFSTEYKSEREKH
jgi:hypothetical protein